MRNKKQLVRLWKRPSKDGRSYTYYLRYHNLDNKERLQSLQHADARKAEKERLAKEKELRMEFCPPDSMKLKQFMEDCLRRSGNQITPSTKTEYRQAMEHFIRTIGNIDFQDVTHRHGEQFRQACLDQGNAKNTVGKKIRQIKALFQLAVRRKQLDENPFQYIRPPKVSKKRKIRTYSDFEIDHMLRAASELQKEHVLEWDLAITLALTTGLRKGELLNATWIDIDFSEMTIEVTPKGNTDETWE